MIKEEVMSDRIRQPQKTVALSAKARPISRYDAKLLNTFAHMYDHGDVPPSGTVVTVSSVVVPVRPLSRSESALYKELYDFMNGGGWNVSLKFPNTVPAYGAENPQNAFIERIGKYELTLYRSFIAMIENEVEPR